MIVGMDATFLLHFFAPIGSVEGPTDSTGKPVEFVKERVDALVKDMEKTGAKIIVGTPALSEISVRAGVQAAQTWIAIMSKSPHFKIVEFDIKSALEVAVMVGNAVKGEGGKAATSDTFAKLKYDRQIVAIAHTEGATVFYTDDGRQANMAARLGMAVKGTEDLPIPANKKQITIEEALQRQNAQEPDPAPAP